MIGGMLQTSRVGQDGIDASAVSGAARGVFHRGRHERHLHPVRTRPIYRMFET